MHPSHPATEPPASEFPGPFAELLASQALAAPSRPGVLANLDRFELTQVLGKGGMGLVFLARDPERTETVAIKMVRLEYLDQPRITHRFLAEAQYMQKLSHPHILKVLEISPRRESPYFVMPYLPTGSLARLLQPGVPLAPAFILPLARQVADALRYAHERGLIHRDIKPANILLDSGGNAFLADFGLARSVLYDSIVDMDQASKEGTVAYMSPALVSGKVEDTRCDIYAFGVVLYEMLTGHLAYEAQTPEALRKLILAAPPRPVRERNPHAPPGLAAVCQGAMARNHRDRYASMADVVTDLDHIGSGALPLGPAGGSLWRAWRSRIQVALWVAGFTLTALCGIAAVKYELGHRAPGSRPAAAQEAALGSSSEGYERELQQQRRSVLQTRAPRGKILFYGRRSPLETSDLWVVNTDNSKPIRLLGDASTGVGRWVVAMGKPPEIVCAYSRDGASRELWRIKSDGTLSALTTMTNGVEIPFVDAAGQHLAFMRLEYDSLVLRTMNTDGSSERAVQAFDVQSFPNLMGWLPDGSSLLVRTRGAEDPRGGGKLYQYPLKGGPPSLFLDPAAVGKRAFGCIDFSKDARQIAWSAQDGNDSRFRDIFVTDLEHGVVSINRVRRLTLNSQCEDSPVFSPDGARLLFARSLNRESGLGAPTAMILVRTDGSVGEIRLVEDFYEAIPFGWAAWDR